MSLSSALKGLLETAVVISVLGIVACGPSAEPIPTATKAPPPTVVPPPALILPTPVATPTATAAPALGVTATPRPAATPTPTPKPAEQPKRGGTVTLPASSGVWSFDPLHSQAGFSWNSLGSIGNVYSQLIRVSPKDRLTVEGDLAESFSANQDGTVWKFKIRSGVVDHEGNPYTVQDAWYQMVRYVQKPNGVPAQRQGCIGTYVNTILDAQGNLAPNAGAEITGPNELTIRLKAPRGAFISCLASGWTVFLPHKYIERIDTAPGGKYRDLDPSKGEMVGTGPFKVTETVIDNRATWARFDKFFRPGLPYLDQINMVQMLESTTRIAAFRAGRVDGLGIFDNQPGKREIDELLKDVGDQLATPFLNAMGWRGLTLNVRKPPFGPVDDPSARNLRFAIQQGLDRQEMNKLAYDGIGVLSTPYFFPWDWLYTPEGWFKAMPGYDPNPAVRAQQLAAAQGLMKKEGYGPDKPFKVSFVCGVGNKLECEAVAGLLKTIYYDVALDVVDAATNRARQTKGDFLILGIESVGASFPDPDWYNLGVYFPFEEGGRNFTGWNNTEFRKLFNQQVALTTDAARAPILRKMAQIVYDEAAMIGINRPNLIHGYRSNWRGYVPPIIHASNYTLESVWLATK